MAPKQQPEAENEGFWTTIKESLKKLAELRIVTVVGENRCDHQRWQGPGCF